MNSFTFKSLTLTALISGFLFSCKTDTKLSFDYKIKGNLITTLASTEIPMSKSTSNYTNNGNVSIDKSLLEKQHLFNTSIKRDSSTCTIKTDNGTDSQSFYTIRRTKFTSSTFDLLEEKGKSRSYTVAGNIESKIMTVKNTVDTSNFILKGTFSDTILINSAHLNYADKMSQYIIDKELLKYLENEMYKQTKDLANRE